MRINLFRRNNIGNDELIKCLKDYLERKKQEYASMTEVPNDYNDAIRTLKSASDEVKVEFKKETGLSTDDLLLAREYMKFLYNYLLVYSATTYLSSTDVGNLINDKEVEEIINNTKQDYPNWLDVFQNLIVLPSFVQRYYIAQINCDNATKENLRKALEEKDYTSFDKCVSPMGKESYLLVNVVDLYKFALDTSKLCEDGPDNYHQNMMISKMYSELEKDTNTYNAICKITKLHSYVDASSTEDEQESVSSMRFDEMKDLYLLQMNNYLSVRMAYLKERDNYSKEIQDIVDPYVVDPEEIDFYVELKKRGCTFDAIDEDDADEVSFDDLIIFYNNPGSRKDEYFEGLDSQIVSEGDEIFKEFVNYIADSGCIDRSSKAKQLFTYRLTGRCRPNKDKLPKLKWCGLKNNSPNELIYVIKYATLRTGTKYPRMKEFFEGPNFPKNSCSSYADQAGLDFRYKLNEFYPGVFKLKK